MSRPTICFVTGSTAMWGAEHSLLTLARALAARGDRPELVTSGAALAQSWRAALGSDARLVRAGSSRVGRLPGFVLALRHLPPGATVVLFDIYLHPLVPILRVWAAATGGSIVVDAHDSRRRNPRRLPYFAFARIAHGAVCVSSYIARQYPRGLPTRVVWRGVEADGSPEPSRVRDELVVAMVGQVAPQKRVLEGIRAFAEVRTDAVLEIRGSGVTPAYLAEVADEGRRLLGRRFRMRGRLPADEVLTGLDVLLFMNDDEPSGRVVAEAQRRAITVVGPASGGVDEFVVDGVTGLTFAPEGEGCVAALRRALEDPHARAAIGQRAGAHAAVAYDPAIQAGRYREAVEAFASRAPKRQVPHET
ncbi:MAG: glycosyltransferase family 4 protein [Protaetiibacter sp.]